MQEDLLKLDKQLCFRLYAVSRKMTRLYQPHLTKFNLTYPQYIVMLVLFEKEKIDFKELSTIVDLKTGTLTPIINKLMEHGYVRKMLNPNDNRKVDVVLTEEGYGLKEEVVEVPLRMNEELEISEDLYNVLTSELDQLSELLSHATVKSNV